MEDLHASLKELQLGLQALLKKYDSLKKENEQLKNLNEEMSRQLLEKENLIASAEEKITTNKITGSYSSEERQLLQSKIDIYLKDIEKCLGLLNV